MSLKPDRLLWLVLLTPGVVAAQPMPPPPPPPPAFMTMKGLALFCFAKPTFEEDGLEFFVCNGGGGLAGVRKKSDPSHSIFVRDLEIAQNLNMQAAKAECGKKRFAVSGHSNGTFSFLCDGEEIGRNEKFKLASPADWKKYTSYLK